VIISGICGATVSDILCNRTPLVLHKELYASVSLIVALFYLTLIHFDVNHEINLIASFCLGMGLRMAAIRWSLSLPTFSYKEGSWREDSDPAPPADRE